MKRTAIVTICVLLFSYAAEAAMGQAPPADSTSVSYDDFMLKHTPDERIRLFNEISAANRADLMRTHLKRTLELRRGELTREQVQFIERAIPALTPEVYSVEGKADRAEWTKSLRQEAEAAFGPDEAKQVLTLTGDHVPGRP